MALNVIVTNFYKDKRFFKEQGIKNAYRLLLLTPCVKK